MIKIGELFVEKLAEDNYIGLIRADEDGGNALMVMCPTSEGGNQCGSHCPHFDLFGYSDGANRPPIYRVTLHCTGTRRDVFARELQPQVVCQEEQTYPLLSVTD